MFTEYIQKPLHNILLWLTGMMPGNSLALAIILFAILTNVFVVLVVYHGHINNIIHHQIRKHAEILKKKHKNSKESFIDELAIIYDHYKFNPWKGIFLVILQFFIFFAIIDFLYIGANAKFYDLDLVIMENIFMAQAMNTVFMGMDLFNPISNWFFIVSIIIIQFVSLEVYLLTKRKLHKTSNHEEKIEHIINFILAGFIGYASTVLPLALSLYWVFFLLFGILVKIIFDKYIDSRIVLDIKKIEQKIERSEEPEVRKFDETLIFYVWKLFNPKSHEKNYIALRNKIHKKYLLLHHSCHIHHPQRKLYEEPFLWAMILLTLLIIGFNIWK